MNDSIVRTMIELKDQVVIVTGAAQGIGRAIAVEFAKVGAKVVVSDLQKDAITEVVEEIEKIGGTAISIPADVSKKADVDNLVKKVVEEWGAIHILVNNAGIFPQSSFEEIDVDAWKKVFAVNVEGIYYFCKAVLPYMKKQKGGKIVNVASIAGIRVGFPHLTHYSGSKSAVEGFSRALALELGDFNIQVNVVAPGAIKTPGATQDGEQEDNPMIQAVPLKRWGNPEEIAYATIFLSSPQANYITGETLVVDGGYTIQ